MRLEQPEVLVGLPLCSSRRPHVLALFTGSCVPCIVCDFGPRALQCNSGWIRIEKESSPVSVCLSLSSARPQGYEGRQVPNSARRHRHLRNIPHSFTLSPPPPSPSPPRAHAGADFNQVASRSSQQLGTREDPASSYRSSPQSGRLESSNQQHSASSPSLHGYRRDVDETHFGTTTLARQAGVKLSETQNDKKEERATDFHSTNAACSQQQHAPSLLPGPSSQVTSRV